MTAPAPGTLHSSLENVRDETTFLAFVRALADDRRASAQAESAKPSPPWSADAGDWENTRIDTFLDAAVAWAEDSDFGRSQGLHPDNPWKAFAVFLYCGKTYE